VSPLLAFEVSLLPLATAVSLVFAIWRIRDDVRKIREHFDRVDRLAAQKLGYSPRPAEAARRSGSDPDVPGSLGLKP
jgi:hypothetical protein